MRLDNNEILKKKNRSASYTSADELLSWVKIMNRVIPMSIF